MDKDFMKMFSRLPLMVVTLLIFLSTDVVLATDDQAASKEENLGPVVMLQTLTHRLLVQMEEEREQIKKDGSQLFDLADKVLLKHFDIKAMSRWVLGKHWKAASTEQRQQFTQEFQMLVVRFYVSALFEDPKLLDEILEMGDRIITYEPVTWDEKTKKVRVKALFSVPSGLEIPVNFKLYYSKKGVWLIYDVNVDGISLITNYRNSFGAEIRKDGLATMLDRLINKNREKSDKLTALR